MATANQRAQRPRRGATGQPRMGGQQRQQRGGYSTGSSQGGPGGYSTGAGGGIGTHPAHDYAQITSAEGHFKYCYRLIGNARDGRSGTQMAFGHLRSEIMKASSLTPEEKRFLIRRLRREYRGLSASFNAQARRAARVARVRQDADAHVASGAVRDREMNGRGWARRIG